MPISTVRTKGEKWVKLLRAYAPVADNEAMHVTADAKIPIMPIEKSPTLWR
jgi:hypothetical protein